MTQTDNLHEALLQAVMDWVELATSLPLGKVRPLNDPAPRPALPYITVNLTVADIEVGTDETRWRDDAGELRASVEGERRATVSLQAYGRKGADLLALCQASLYQPATQRFLSARNITVRRNGGTQNISQLVDTEIEARFVRDFDVEYRLRIDQADPEAHVERVQADVELEGTPDNSLIAHVEVD